jgi:hypothetical protein
MKPVATFTLLVLVGLLWAGITVAQPGDFWCFVTTNQQANLALRKGPTICKDPSTILTRIPPRSHILVQIDQHTKPTGTPFRWKCWTSTKCKCGPNVPYSTIDDSYRWAKAKICSNCQTGFVSMDYVGRHTPGQCDGIAPLKYP